MKQFEFADMNLWLGAGWERLGRPRAPKGSWPWRKGKSGLQEEEWNNLEGPVVYQDAGPDEFEDIQSSTKPSVSAIKQAVISMAGIFTYLCFNIELLGHNR